MPRMRRLSGKDVISILITYGFEIYSQSGSHVKLERITEAGERQRIVVAVHGKKSIKPATLRSIYRAALQFIPEDELQPDFYADA